LTVSIYISLAVNTHSIRPLEQAFGGAVVLRRQQFRDSLWQSPPDGFQ